MQSKRYSPKSFDVGTAAAFGARSRGGAPCPRPRSRSTATSARGSTNWCAITSTPSGTLGTPLEGDFAKAARLGLEFSEDFEPLEDLGWAEDKQRERSPRPWAGPTV